MTVLQIFCLNWSTVTIEALELINEIVRDETETYVVPLMILFCLLIKKPKYFLFQDISRLNKILPFIFRVLLEE